MDVRVLGAIEVHNGHVLALGGPRQRRILAALAMRSGEVLSIDQLVDITWSGGGLFPNETLLAPTPSVDGSPVLDL